MWWALVEELHERLRLNQILGLEPDSRVMELRRRLLLYGVARTTRTV
jgi:hypothetical protein